MTLKSSSSSESESSVSEHGRMGQVPAGAFGCPVVHGVGFDPMKIDQIINPHPWLSVARRESPVFYMPEYDSWCVTRYEDVLSVLRDTSTFSSARVVEPRDWPELDEALPDGSPVALGLVNMDPPEHTRLRKLAQKAFTPKLIQHYEPVIRETAHRLVDELETTGPPVNLVERFTRQLASETLTSLIGVPRDLAAYFQRASDANLASLADSATPTPEERETTVQTIIAYNAWLEGFIEEKRQNPQDDFTSYLVQATTDDGSPSLSTVEVIRTLTTVILAGVDTTSSLITAMMYLLLTDPARWERVKADPSRAGRVVDESARLEGPVRGLRRDVVEDTTIGGVAIPKGSVLYISYTSAQRDESVFTDPDTFDIDRADISRAFPFGRWTHICLGAPLAKLEAKIALETFIERLPTMYLPEGSERVPLISRMQAFLTGFTVAW